MEGKPGCGCGSGSNKASKSHSARSFSVTSGSLTPAFLPEGSGEWANGYHQAPTRVGEVTFEGPDGKRMRCPL